VTPFEFLDEFFIPKTRVLALSVGDDIVMLACVVFTQYQRVTDRQTDGIPAAVMANIGLAATLTPCKIEVSKMVNELGVWVNNELQWNDHCGKAAGKPMSVLGVIKRSFKQKV